jgi:hypothetical protein
MINNGQGNVKINILNVAKACEVPTTTAEHKTELCVPVIFIKWVYQLQEYISRPP